MYFPFLLFFLLPIDFICAELNGWEMAKDGPAEMLHPLFLGQILAGYLGPKAFGNSGNLIESHRLGRA
jgi:hypothetical protein